MKGAIMTTRQTKSNIRITLFFLGCMACGAAAATQITYYPNNPSFGGSPLNGPVLLNSAQAQNKHTDDPDLDSSGDMYQAPTALQDFNDTLQRSILSRVAASASSQIMGNDGTLHPGTIDTTDFSISVVNAGGGLLRITTTDKATGAQTSFQVGQ
jgi:curli production assembly/transport component CsgF